jgi:excisionase family DNA binding protein
VSTGGKLVRASVVAERLGLSVRTVRRRIKDKTLPSVRVGGARLIDWEAFERQSGLGELSLDEPAAKEPDREHH